MSGIRECPFCGSAAVVWSGALGVMVNCTKCAALGPHTHGDKQDAVVAKWNRRDPDWERKWGELVETVSSRTDQAAAAKVTAAGDYPDEDPWRGKR